MKNGEMISVIVPVYKVEKFLDKCVQSIVEQTYENLEIILVDDGSPDNCPAICDDWAARDSRIKVIHKNNGGISDVRNIGMAAASGKYIGFVDSDDYIEKNMYEKLYKVMEKENADIVMCNYDKLPDIKDNEDKSPVKNEVFNGTQGLKKLYESQSGYYAVVWNKLYKKNILSDIEFPVGKLYEDIFVMHMIFFKCKKIVTLENKLYHYVQRTGSIINSAITTCDLDCVEAICSRIQFYRKNELDEFIPKEAFNLKRRYIKNRKFMEKPKEKSDKDRVKEIDELFKKTYLNSAKKISLFDRILCVFPAVVFFYMRIKSKMLTNKM